MKIRKKPKYEYNDSSSFAHPSLFLMGAPKCGTTTLSKILSQHPSIYLSVPKEPNFFHREIFENGMEEYFKKYLRGYNEEKYVLDASQGSFIAKYAPRRILETCGIESKFIFILRNPLERAYSDWLSWNKHMRSGIMADTFNGELERNLIHIAAHPRRYALEGDMQGNSDKKGYMYDPYIIDRGMYYENIRQVSLFFKKENIYICTLSEVETIADDIFKWLGCEKTEYKARFLNKTKIENGELFFEHKTMEITLVKEMFYKQLELLYSNYECCMSTEQTKLEIRRWIKQLKN